MFIFQKYATFWQGLTKYPQNLLALAAGIMTCILFFGVLLTQAVLPPIAQQEVELPVASGVLKGTLWLPQTKGPQSKVLQSQAVPGVVLVPGRSGSRRSMQHLAKTLAYNGMGAFVFDLQGYGESRLSSAAGDPYARFRENVVESLRFLQSHPAIQAHQIAFVGHALGAEVMAQLPDTTPGLRIALSLSPEDFPPHGKQSHGKLQKWTGLYAPLHPPKLSYAYVSACTGSRGAPEDLCLAQHLQKNLASTFSLASPSSLASYGVLKAQLHHWSTVVLGVCLLVFLTALPLAPGGYPLLLATLVALGPFVLAGYFRWLYAPYCASAMVLITLGYFLRQFSAGALKKVGLGILGIWGIHLAVSTLRGSYALLTVPELSLSGLLQWPLFVFQSLILLLQVPHDVFLAWGFTQTYARTEPGPLLIGLFMLEIIWPGGIVGALRGCALRVSALKKRGLSGLEASLMLCFGLYFVGDLGGLIYAYHQQGLSVIKIAQKMQPLFWGALVPELLSLLLVLWVIHRCSHRLSSKEAPPR